MHGLLPKRTAEYLARGAQQGQRNDELMHAACQFRDANYTQAEAEAELVPRAIADGLGEIESRKTVSSAFSREAREALHGGLGGQKQIYRGAGTNGTGPIPGPVPSPICPGFIPYLNACFEAAEFVAIGDSHLDDDGHPVIEAGVTLRRDEWIRRATARGGIEKVFSGKTGLYIRVNAVTQGGKHDSDVTAFRHVLIESDVGSKEEQFAALTKSNFPISAVVDSGGVSLHGLVRVDAQSLVEWKARAKTVYDWFSPFHVDPKNANPSRYSRVPDAFRTVNGVIQRQSLLSVQIGAKDWGTWISQNESDGLPLIVPGLKFQAFTYENEPQIILGVLEKGSKLVIGGPSKARKTWVLLDLMVSVANGARWLNFPTVSDKVLYLNFELSDKQLHRRIKWLMESKGLDSWANFDVWNLRGFSADLAQLIDRITLRIAASKYGLVIIDPIYKCLGGRNENDSGHMTEFLGHIERLINSIGAAVVFSAHFPKGNLNRRYAMDRIAGSGVFARDPDAILTMSPISGKKVPFGVTRFSIDTTVRNFLEVPSFMVDWQAPLMVPVSEEDSQRNEPVTVPLGRPPKFAVVDLLALLPPGGSTFTLWYMAAKNIEMSLATFKRLLGEAKLSALILFEEKSQKYFHSQNVAEKEGS